jgi:hypothetical protein
MSNKAKLYLSIFLSLVFISLIYFFQAQVDETVTDVNLIHRRIETPIKFWMNGYLGHFFNFKYLGNINWLLLPLSLFAFLKLNYFNQEWKKSFAVAYLLALVLISVKGYFNARYQLTLLPITLSALLYFLWLYLEHQDLQMFKKFVLIIIIGLVLSNDVFGLLFSRVSNQIILQQKHQELVERLINNVDSLSHKIANFENKSKTAAYILQHHRLLLVQNLINYVDSIQNNIRRSSKGLVELLINYVDSISHKIAYLENKSKTPAYPVIDFIRKEIPDDERFLVNNLPMLYYYTNKKGIYYWCGDDTYYTKNGRSRLMENRSIEQIMLFIKDSLNCNYLLSTPTYNKYDSNFEEFTRTYCKPIFLDLGEFAVYEISREKGNYSIEPMAKELSKRLNKGIPPFYVTSKDVE